MKNNYHALKKKVLLEILSIAGITAVSGFFITAFLIDGILQKPFADNFISFCRKYLDMEDNTAHYYYQIIFRDNKTTLMFLGFVILLLLFFYIAMTRFTRYFNQISAGVDVLLAEDSATVTLSPELAPMEYKLNAVKEALRQRKKAMLDSEQRKSELITYLAHDIKTPLTSVIGYLSLIQDTPDLSDELKKKYNAVALEKSYRLEELINELFEVTRFNANSVRLEISSFSLTVMLEQLADEFYPILSAKSMRCAVQAPAGFVIQGDANKLARAFNNILKNAAAYGEPNSTIQIIADSPDSSMVRLLFRNKGKQIPPEQLNLIFQKFYRLDTARSSNTGGAGLGLAIAKEIIELHRGSISAESSPEYTQFMILLPQRQQIQKTGRPDFS